MKIQHESKNNTKTSLPQLLANDLSKQNNKINWINSNCPHIVYINAVTNFIPLENLLCRNKIDPVSHGCTRRREISPNIK